MRGVSAGGTSVAVDLARGSFLRHGAVLADDGERIIVVDRALEAALERWSASGRNGLPEHGPRLRAFVDDRRRRWIPPREYVLSHMDGLQAMVQSVTPDTGGGWTVTGHVDLEDFAFLDARLPLAGFQLSLGIRRRRPLPDTFWDGYRSRATVAPDFATAWQTAWPVFRLYYLLEWSWIAFDSRRHGSPAEQAADIERFERAIVELAELDDGA
jgi:hypothetical protein